MVYQVGAADYARWMTQLEVRRGHDRRGIATREDQEKWVEENLEKGAKRTPNEAVLVVFKPRPRVDLIEGSG